MSRSLLPAVVAVAAVTFFGCAASTAAASDDTQLVYQGASGRFTVAIEPGAVRIDDASRQWQLYRQKDAAVFAVDPVRHSYTRLDESTAATIRQQVEALRARIQNKVEQLPESQQATARAAMIQSIPALDAGKHRVGLERTGRKDAVAGVSCEVVQVIRDGQPAETLCVASADALGISAAAFDSVQSMFKLMRTMLAGTGFQAAGLPYLNLEGMPIRFTDTETGERRRLVRVAHEPQQSVHFDIPGNYRRQRIGAPGR